MKILYLGYAVSKEDSELLTGASIAGNKMQLNIIKNLKKIVDELEIITVYPIASFPKEKRVFVLKKKITLYKNIKSIRAPFINLPLIKQITQAFTVWIIGRKYMMKNPDAVILTFNMFPQVGLPAFLLKKYNRNKVASILADLPIDDNYQRKGISKYFRHFFDSCTKKLIKTCDKIIVLNECAAAKFAPSVRYLVIEGGVDLETINRLNLKKEKKKKIIVYSGALSEYSGIKELVIAMKYVCNKTIVLNIYGDGSLREYIENLNCRNVKYCGIVSNQKVIEIQNEAWLLVNPRSVDDEIAKVTFPSKMFEYMTSGTAVLTTRLNGFTADYDDKVFFAENNSPNTLADKINDIDLLNNQDLVDKAIEAYNFVVINKNWDIQVKKIMKFIFEDEFDYSNKYGR